MIKTTTLSALMISSAALAYAGNLEPAPAEPVVFEPAAVAAPFWAGGYAGVQLGYVYSEFDLGSATSPDDFDDDSVIGGFNFGYLWELNNGWHIGPEFQYDFADVSVADAGTGDTASFDEIARLKLIVGREVGQGLVYGSAGIAYASFDDVGTIFDGFDGSDTNYVLGFGYDHRLGENWTLGGEYMYHAFNGVGASGGDVDVNTLHVKATYRF
ncbi:outer membrane protein [Roseobacter sinensis]|uniref:Porin family protein n=1 Tax=Roseobacter sinensis TaxID=2931391 RepID=A0ABT3B9B6_9RHOB|nr:porin family protein [Roseobacter sp. WL0113]MCV3270160.1 porin family protein [Roseobacter sp. WL0113]